MTSIPSRGPCSSTFCRSSAATASYASCMEVTAPAPIPATALNGRTYRTTSLAFCRRAMPAAYAPARSDVSEPSTATSSTSGPSRY